MLDATGQLRELARQIVRLSDEHGSTPVLVLPPYLSLRRPFYESLVAELSEQTQRPIRFDWCRPTTGLTAAISDRVAQFRAARLSRSISRVTDAVFVLTASIARPGGPRRDLVIGLCDEQLPLPPWTTPIRIR